MTFNLFLWQGSTRRVRGAGMRVGLSPRRSTGFGLRPKSRRSWHRVELQVKFWVRNQEGDLIFESFGAVEQAWLQGLVGPEDEILEDGASKWRKAKTFPLLVQ